ncbi:MAG: tetratricopeptide repeat protein [Candidatus Thorarchaeota archaeon]|jgi:tetratricopeptide (TPR) repeat protein
MGKEEGRKLPIRDTYTVKTLLGDLRRIRLTPGALYTIGSEVVYFEWKQAVEDLGEEDQVTLYLAELLDFMQSSYEHRLLRGDIYRKKDTPAATINTFLKDTPVEFQLYVLQRPGEFISGVLRAARAHSDREIQRYSRIERGLKQDLEKSPKDPELWNQLRLTLWILGRYDEASEAFKEARRLGWDKKRTKTVGT